MVGFLSEKKSLRLGEDQMEEMVETGETLYLGQIGIFGI